MQNNNKQVLHRKEWQMMTPAPTASVAGAFIVKDPLGIKRTSLYVTSATAHYLYAVNEDAWMQVPSMTLAGTFGAGACGCWGVWSNTLTATTGTTSSLTISTAIDDACVGETIRFLSGTNLGQEVTITSARVNPSDSTSVINFSPALANAVTTETFAVSTGRYYILNAGTNANGIFKSYDPLTATITSLGYSGLPNMGTDGKMTTTSSYINNAYNLSGTATSATSTTLTDTTKSVKVNSYKNFWIITTGGTGSGQVRKILSNTANTVTVAAWSVTPDATTTYKVMGSYSAGVATAGGATTLTDSTKSWTGSSLINYQVRIIAGTGIGQVRTITANTGTALTVATWTVNPDTTSIYVIEANDDFLYLAGNGAVTLYRYSISAGTWSTLSPIAARSGAPSTGMSFNWIGIGDMDTWADESNLLNGRYIYSFRGGATSTLDRYDIAGNTWLSAISYKGATETFTTGSSYDYDTGRIYMRKDATNRFFYYCVPGNHVYPFSTNTFPDGTALIGDKTFTVCFTDTDSYGNPTGDTICWVYELQNTGTALHRIMVIDNSAGIF